MGDIVNDPTPRCNLTVLTHNQTHIAARVNPCYGTDLLVVVNTSAQWSYGAGFYPRYGAPNVNKDNNCGSCLAEGKIWCPASSTLYHSIRGGSRCQILSYSYHVCQPHALARLNYGNKHVKGSSIPSSHLYCEDFVPSNEISKSFDKPSMVRIAPVPLDANGGLVQIHGNNLGGISHKVQINLGAESCENPQWVGPNEGINANNTEPILTCIAGRQYVGNVNVTVIANEQGAPQKDNLLYTRCKRGYYGLINEQCKPCPLGGICPGGLAESRAQKNWWKVSNESFVMCIPLEACLGNNTCAEGYTGEFCGSCSREGGAVGTGYYRHYQSCLSCTGMDGHLLFVIFVCCILCFCIVIITLTFMDTKLASINILIDFYQIVAMISSYGLAWPMEVKILFRFSSMFMMNFQVVGPECYISDWSFSQLWYLLEFLPMILLMGVILCFFGHIAYRYCQKGCCCCKPKRKIVRLHGEHDGNLFMLSKKGKQQRLAYFKKNQIGSHAPHMHSTAGAASLILFYVYIILLQINIQVHDCTSFTESRSVLDVDPSEPCDLSANTFYRDVFYLSILFTFFYGAGIPAYYIWVFYHFKKEIKQDLSRRSRGIDVEGVTTRQVPAAIKIQSRWRGNKLRKALLKNKSLRASFTRKQKRPRRGFFLCEDFTVNCMRILSQNITTGKWFSFYESF